jgi:hypothetical protein
MTCSGTPFKYCNTEAELEIILEDLRPELEKDNRDIKITFTLAGEDDKEDGSSIGSSIDDPASNL